MNTLLKIALLLSIVSWSAEANEISIRLLSPDGLQASQGKTTSVKVMLANHSSQEQLLACYLHTPDSWEPLPSSQLFYLPANTARIVPMKVKVPSEVAKGNYRIAIGLADADSQALLGCEQLTLSVR